MTAKGHIAIGTAIATYTGILLQSYEIGTSSVENILIVLIIILFSLVPDIDEPKSYIGRRFFIISEILSLFIKHRGITHTALFAISISLLGYILSNSYSIYLYAASIGIIAHDIGDMLTKGGIRGFFFPFLPNTTIALLPKALRFYTNSATEYLFIFICLLPLNVYLGMHLWRIS